MLLSMWSPDMLVQQLEDSLFQFFPKEDAESWDHVGLSVGDPKSAVSGVLCALDATEDAVHQAVHAGCNVLLTHHPVYITAPRVFAPASSSVSHSSSVVYSAAQCGVSIISMHTNLDRSPAVQRFFTKAMGLQYIASLENFFEPDHVGLGVVCEGSFRTLQTFVSRVADVFDGCPRVWGDTCDPIHRIAFLGGSLGDFGELALDHDVDVIVTGEVGYHRAQDIMLRGCSIVELGHDISEFPFVDILANHAILAGLDPSLVSTIIRPKQWWTFDKGVCS